MTLERLHNYRLLLVEREQIKALIAEAEERRRELWAAAVSLGGCGDGMPHVRAGHPDSKLVNYVDARDQAEANHLALVARYRAKLIELDAEQLAIEQAVDALPVREASIIRAKYIEGLKVNEICDKLNYSRRTVFRLLESAEELLARV